ncbi:hypothetical protein ACFFGH_23065 [Lysobacter korlensis]|uniref:General secretion pathway protein GspM n=1 Tax=Lysobacter korlensis TaxID=553636 RepID=A0ABV6RXV6_9GAMM
MSINRLLAAAAGAGAIGILLLGWLLGVSPKLAEIAAADAETATAAAQNAALEASNAALRKQFESIEEHRRELEALVEAVPADAATDDFVDAVENTAIASDVVLQSISFGEGVSYGAGGAGVVPVADGAAAPAAPEELAGLVTVEVNLTVAGDPARAMEFVDDLQTGDRLLTVTQVITDGSAPGMTTLRGFLYVLLGEAAPES